LNFEGDMGWGPKVNQVISYNVSSGVNVYKHTVAILIDLRNLTLKC